MFNNSETTVCSFESSWKKELSTTQSSSQTDAVVAKDAEVQLTTSESIGIQTDEERVTSRGAPNYNEDSLLNFLRYIAPKVEQELEKSLRSRAFVSYSTVDETAETEVKILHTLRWQQADPEYIITCLDWSCTGSVIGIGYGMKLHEDWCSHKGAIAFWNINVSDFASNAPEQHMDISTCVTCIAFHPSNPALVAAANKSGEIMIFDLSKSGEVTPAHSSDTDGVEVTCLNWGNSSVSSAFSLQRTMSSLIAATVSGEILVWNLSVAKDTLTLASGYIVQSQDIPRDVRSRGETSDVRITSLSFSFDDPTLFLVGTEGGALLLGSTLSQTPSGVTHKNLNLVRCITASLAPHTGSIFNVETCRHHRHAVHSLGSDNTLRLHSLLQPNKAVSVIYVSGDVTCSKWSCSRPMVVVVGESSGNVTFFDFGSQKSEPILRLKPAEKAAPISALMFTKKNMNILAAGDQLGRVFIWQLPDHVVSPKPAEQTALGELLEIEIEA